MKVSSFSILAIMVSLFFISIESFAQKKGTVVYNEGSTPKVHIYQDGDTSKVLSKLKKNKENRIKVVIEGGIDRVKSNVYVTSKNANVTKVAGTKYEYIIVPQDDNCEIIVDIKLEENFFAFKTTEVKGKKVRKLERDYIPKTYMLAYETIPTF